MTPCGTFLLFVSSIRQIAESLWSLVRLPWLWCSAQPCTWWCLCCNRWLCWLVLIALAVLVIALLVVTVVGLVLMLITCWAVCLVFAVLNAIGRSPVPNCFAPNPPPPAGPPPGPAPVVVITQPADGSSFPDGDTVPIAFTATVTLPDGTPVPNPDLRWGAGVPDSPNAPEIPLPTGLSVSATLPRRSDDVRAGRLSAYTVTAFLPAAGAQPAASAMIQVSVGLVAG